MPPAAIVEYPAAIESGETARAPRPIEGTVRCVPSSTPSLCAVARTRSGPTSIVSWAYTELSERNVARATDVLPTYELSYVFTFHSGEHQRLSVQTKGAEV